MSKTKDRFFDDDDFKDDEHTAIFFRLLKAWKSWSIETVTAHALHIFRSTGDLNGVTHVSGEIFGEPSLPGYPPVFPDAVARADFEVRHPSTLLTYYTASSGNRILAKCPIDNLSHDAGFFSPGEADKLLEKLRTDEPTRPLCRNLPVLICFEIKTKVNPARDLRQINLYRERLHHPEVRSQWKVREASGYMRAPEVREVVMMLVTPDTQYDAMFAGQGIYVIHPSKVATEDSSPV